MIILFQAKTANSFTLFQNGSQNIRYYILRSYIIRFKVYGISRWKGITFCVNVITFAAMFKFYKYYILRRDMGTNGSTYE